MEAFSAFKPNATLLDLFGYELVMMNETYLSIMKGGHGSEYERNAKIESFLLHARNIIDFLSDNRKQEDDLTCSDFVTEKGGRVPAISLRLPRGLKKKIDKHLSHLTKTRLTEKLGWDLHVIRGELIRGAIDFFGKCSVGHFKGEDGRKKIRDQVNLWLTVSLA